MALAKKPNKNPDIPGTSSEPAKCRQNVGDEEDTVLCGERAVAWFSLEITVFTKAVKVKLPVCQKHLDMHKEKSDASGS